MENNMKIYRVVLRQTTPVGHTDHIEYVSAESYTQMVQRIENRWGKNFDITIYRSEVWRTYK